MAGHSCLALKCVYVFHLIFKFGSCFLLCFTKLVLITMFVGCLAPGVTGIGLKLHLWSC